MKNLKILFWCCMVLFAFTACEKETENHSTNDPTNLINQVFVEGETNGTENRGKKGKLCGVFAPECAAANQIHTLFYNTPSSNPNATWTVDSGAITLISGQGTSVATFSFGSSFSGGQITATGLGAPDCTVIIEIPLCSGNDCDYVVAVLDEYIDGTQSGANFVYLHAGGNFPAGTTYAWTITRQDGSVQNYAAATNNPRLVAASISNRIVSATVTAVFEDCEETATNNFWCAIPHADINGDLFPECQ